MNPATDTAPLSPLALLEHDREVLQRAGDLFVQRHIIVPYMGGRVRALLADEVKAYSIRRRSLPELPPATHFYLGLFEEDMLINDLPLLRHIFGDKTGEAIFEARQLPEVLFGLKLVVKRDYSNLMKVGIAEEPAAD